MRQVTITRGPSTPEGTFGDLQTDTGFRCKTAELQWQDNKPRVSSIPAGSYVVEWATSPKFGPCYHLKDVPGRSHILIHPGNFAGDTAAGLKSDLLGCIALGQKVGLLNGQLAVFSSRSTVDLFEEEMKQQPFLLTLTNAS